MCRTCVLQNKGLHIYEDYAQECDITFFYGAKSQFSVFRGCDCKVVIKSQISVNNVILVQTTIGYSSRSYNDDKNSIVSATIAQFWSSFNLFRVHFGHIQPYV